MTAAIRRAASFAALSLFVLGLAACGDSEPDQRKAFIAFLQDINRRQGVHFLVPKPEEKKAFGDYAQHYEIFVEFNQGMGKVMTEVTDQLRKFGLGPGIQQRNVQQMAAHRDDIVAVREVINKEMHGVDTLVEKINTQRAALKQPDDLKAVYSKTFDRLITGPTAAIKHSYAVLNDGFEVTLRLVDYVNAHRDKLAVSGSQIRAKDQRTLDEVNVLLKQHQEAAQRFQEAQRAGKALVDGN